MIAYDKASGSIAWSLFGKTTDEKPTDGIPNMSTFYEIDGEHNVYFFDAETKTWVKQ